MGSIEAGGNLEIHEQKKEIGLEEKSGSYLNGVAIDIMVTGVCNMQCPFCYGNEPPLSLASGGIPLYRQTSESQALTGVAEPRQELGTEEVFSLLETFRGMGIERMSLTGGEPLSRHDMPAILSRAKTLGFYVYLSTNGTYLAERYDEIKDSIDMIGLPIDGSTELMSRRMGRNKNGLVNVVTFLSNIQQEPDRLPFEVKIGTIISHVNRGDIKAIGDILQGLNLEKLRAIWRLYQFVPVEAGARPRVQQRYQITEDEFTSIVSQLQSTFPKIPISPRSYSQHEDAYFLVSSDGFLQTIPGNYHTSILDLRSASPQEIEQVLLEKTATKQKVEETSEWWGTHS